MLLAQDTTMFLKRGLRRALHQISRDRSWGTTLTLLTALMVLMQLLVVFLLGANGVNSLLVSRSAIQLEVLEAAQDQDVQELYAALRAQPFTEGVEYIPREKAYELQKTRDPELVSFLEEYGLANPFPDTFSVTLHDLADYDVFAAFVQQERWRTVVNPSYVSSVTRQESEVRSLLEVTGGLRTLTSLFLFLALLTLCFVMVEWAARATMRREDELTLENLLGAPSHAVLLPFAAEMSILLLCALALGTALVLMVIAALPLLMPALALEAAFVQLRSEVMPTLYASLPFLVLLEIILLPLLAFGGTLLGVKKKVLWPATLFT